MASLDFKAFYYTSLISQLGDQKPLLDRVVKARPHTAIPHSHQERPKKYEIKLQSDELKRVNLPIDSALLRREKEGQKTLRISNFCEENCRKNLAMYKKEHSKAMNELRNDTTFMKNYLKRIHDRKLEIAKSKEEEKLLIQAQCRYNKLPVLEMKRMCAACDQRPKSAKASREVTIEGVLKPGERNRPSSRTLTFSSYERRVTPPRPFVGSSKPVPPKRPQTVCFDVRREKMTSPMSSTESHLSSNDSDDVENASVIGKRMTFFD